MKAPHIILIICASLLFSACSTINSPAYDYSNFRANYPRSILVLPPVNNSMDVRAPYIHLSSVTRPVAEQGYYVFPVALVDQIMKQNGVELPEEMRQVSLQKLKEVFDADAVLYITIEDWGQKYMLLQSQSIVSIRAELVDLDNAAILWTGSERVVRSSSDNQNSAVDMLINAAITQVLSKTISDPMPELSSQASRSLYGSSYNGLLAGPYRPVTNTPPE